MKKQYYLALFVFVVLFTFYLFNAPTKIVIGDASEFATVGAVLGISHPPGYPLYSLIAHLGPMLFPANPALAANATTGFISALAVALTFLLCLKLTADIATALAGCLLFAFCPAFLSSATTAEVYSLNVLLSISILLSFLHWSKEKNIKYARLFGFMAGLGLSNHPTIILLIMPLAFYIIFKSDSKKALLSALLVFILGLTPFLYIIIRAKLKPVLNWNDPSDWPGFWQHIIRAEYLYAGHHTRTLLGFLKQQFHIVKTAGGQFSFYLCWLPVLGLWKLRRKREFLLLTLAIFLLSGPVLGWAINFKTTASGIYHLTPFWMVMAVVLLWWAVEGLKSVRIFLIEKLRFNPQIINVLFVFLAVLPLSVNLKYLPDKHDINAYLYGQNIFNSVPQNGILILDGDPEIFSTAYLQMVEKQRPDITVYDEFGSVYGNIYGRGFTDLLPDSQEAVRQRIYRKLLDSTGVLYFTQRPENLAVKTGFRIYPRGITYALSKKAMLVEDLSGSMEIQGTIKTWQRSDYLSRHVIGRTAQRLGEAALWRGDLGSSDKYFQMAALVAYDNYQVIFEMAGTYLAFGLYQQSIGWYKLALIIDTTAAFPDLGMARAYARLNQFDKSKAHYQRYLAKSGGNEGTKKIIEKEWENIIQ